jgi:hypothetical protein
LAKKILVKSQVVAIALLFHWYFTKKILKWLKMAKKII